MPSPGSVQEIPDLAPREAGHTDGAGAELLRDARGQESNGCLTEAIARYEAAIATAERLGEEEVLVEALRRVAVIRHHQGDHVRARVDCRRSYGIARALANDLQAAEALNTLGGLDLSTGFLDDARRAFIRALELGGASRPLRARVEQNLGILANIQGEVDEALLRYASSLDAYRACEDWHGCAIAYNNLGMVHADRGQWNDAERYYEKAQALAIREGDRYLQALCLVNRGEVDVARQRFENARRAAEEALLLFAELGASHAKADAYRILGMVYRETGRPTMSESRLRTAIELGHQSGSVLSQADAHRELAVLCQTTGRNQDALRHLHASHRLFKRLDARVDLVHVGGKMAELEATYLAVVREWGRSIEARHAGTFGHSERVARYAVGLARALGLDQQSETAVLLGAYLHDLGKTRVPRQLLVKRGPLSEQEYAIMRMHPLWGVELLADVEFPWPLKPIIRWHHERCDGTGYPDRLSGDQIPVEAQIVGLAEVYDALLTYTTNEGGRLTQAQARSRISAQRDRAWSARVVQAFLDA
jgi:putative nucleotidyltransferase with HDIG domain